MIDLGIEPRLVVPFIAAWRNAPAVLDDSARARHVARIMAADHDRTMDAAGAARLATHLTLFLGDLRRDVADGPNAIGATHEACVCCGSALRLEKDCKVAEVELLSLALPARALVDVHCKVCECGCRHLVSEVHAPPASCVIKGVKKGDASVLAMRLHDTR